MPPCRQTVQTTVQSFLCRRRSQPAASQSRKSAAMFFGGVVNPGKPVPLVPHPEGWALHLSQASLPASVKEKSRVSLLIQVQGEEPVVLCTLCAGVADTVLLDQFVAEYAELSVQGSGPVHLTGYFSPNFGGEGSDEEDEEGEDGYGLHPMDQMLAMQNGDSEDEGESDDEDEEGESDEDEDEDESEELGGFQPRGRKEPSVIIEDVTDKEPDNSRALPAPAADDSKKRKAAAAADEAAAKKQAKEEQQQKQQQKQQQDETFTIHYDSGSRDQVLADAVRNGWSVLREYPKFNRLIVSTLDGTDPTAAAAAAPGEATVGVASLSSMSHVAGVERNGFIRAPRPVPDYEATSGSAGAFGSAASAGQQQPQPGSAQQ